MDPARGGCRGPVRCSGLLDADFATVGTPREHETHEALHTASMAVSALRGGPTTVSAVSAAPTLSQLLRTPAVAIPVAIADTRSLLARDGSDRHREALACCLQIGVGSGRRRQLRLADLLGAGTKVTMDLPKYSAAASAA